VKTLQEVNLDECNNMTSVTVPTHTQRLYLADCNAAVSLMSCTSLRILKMGACSKLLCLPDSLRYATSLHELDLTGSTALRALPDWIDVLQELGTLRLKYCTVLTALPASIGNMLSLRTLVVSFCYSLKDLPRTLGRISGLQIFGLECSGVSWPPSLLRQLQAMEDSKRSVLTSVLAARRRRECHPPPEIWLLVLDILHVKFFWLTPIQ